MVPAELAAGAALARVPPGGPLAAVAVTALASPAQREVAVREHQTVAAKAAARAVLPPREAPAPSGAQVRTAQDRAGRRSLDGLPHPGARQAQADHRLVAVPRHRAAQPLPAGAGMRTARHLMAARRPRTVLTAPAARPVLTARPAPAGRPVLTVRQLPGARRVQTAPIAPIARQARIALTAPAVPQGRAVRQGVLAGRGAQAAVRAAAHRRVAPGTGKAGRPAAVAAGGPAAAAALEAAGQTPEQAAPAHQVATVAAGHRAAPRAGVPGPAGRGIPRGPGLGRAPAGRVLTTPHARTARGQVAGPVAPGARLVPGVPGAAGPVPMRRPAGPGPRL